ncbi:MAG TPA: glycosyltransferase [Longimicrobiales bacterium]|nr:glycosyltransferase [Longimicrobiales bacterium]
MATMRTLIVSAGAGTGHLRAGEALKQAMQAVEPRWKVALLDVLRLAPGWVRAAYGGGYELVAAHAPSIWREIYRWADGPQEDHARWGSWAERVLFRSFRRLLKAGAWDLCVCTHFLPAQLAAGRPGFPRFALVVTDFTLHRYWAQERVTRYFVATEELANGLRGRITRAQVSVTGIPVSLAFSRPEPRDAARRALGLAPDQPVAVLLGGGLGLHVEESARALVRGGPSELQVLVICGRNDAARERLVRAGLPARVQIRGYVDQLERFVSAADVVITKPGGLTTSEALAMGRPLVLTRPLPGHEEGNLRALVGMGAAIDGSEPELLARAVWELFASPERLLERRAAAAHAGRANAALRIADELRSELSSEAAA